MKKRLLSYRLNHLLSGNKKSLYLLSAIAAAFLIASCASSRSANVYSRDQAQMAQTVSTGVVTAVRSVLIEGTKTPVGAAAGGAIGGVAGSAVGGGKGSTLMTVVGAIAGGAAGAAAEEGITRKAGFEITVALDNGTTIAVVQEADQAFNVGDRVKVLSSPDGTTRVTY